MQEKSSGFQWPAQWTPDILATLMFVVQKGRILLIRKKRGIGAGKVNGPGGKFEPGETARNAFCGKFGKSFTLILRMPGKWAC